jgi:predicted SprT family Zn-dependent metalloprotease
MREKARVVAEHMMEDFTFNGIPGVRALGNKVNYYCDLCHKHKLLEYLVTDANGEMFSICKNCMDNLLPEQNQNIEDA